MHLFGCFLFCFIFNVIDNIYLMLLILYNRRSTSTTDQESLSARFYCNRAAVVVDQGTKVRTLGVLDFLGKTLAFPSVALKIFSNRGDKVACTSPSMIPLEPRKAKAHHHQYSRFSDTLLARIFHLPWVKRNLCNLLYIPPVKLSIVTKIVRHQDSCTWYTSTICSTS